MSARSTHWNILFAILLPLAAACSPSASNLQAERWVIFSAQQAQNMGVASWVAGSGQTVEYWTPSKDDVLALENGLADFLQNESGKFYVQEEPPVWERLDGYNRQYIGLTVDGRKFIYANFFCDDAAKDWRKDFVLVMDGGSCFFQFKYDPRKGEFFDLRVNGSA